MAELSPQSAVDAKLAKAMINLSRRQISLRKQHQKAHVEWLDEVENIERPGLASQILNTLLEDDDPYQGEALQNKHLDLAATVCRTTDTGRAAIGDQTPAARKFIKPLLIYLHRQSMGEAEQLEAALTSSVPLLSPPQRARAPDFFEKPATAPKKSAEEQYQVHVSELESFNYTDLPPFQRLNNKSILLFLEPGVGTVSLPRWSDLKKGGRAQDLLVGQEEHVSLFLAIIGMTLLKYHKHTSELVEESTVDGQAERMTVDVTDAAGNTTQEERPVFMSVRYYHKFVSQMSHPYAAVQDDAKREQLCMDLWGEIQSAAASIGRRSLTTILADVVERSPTTDRANAEVAAQSRKGAAGTSKVTPAKKGAASNPNTGKREHCPLTLVS